MDERLQEMLDHYEIRKTLSAYCQGADRVDRDMMASVYVEDSWDDHGNIKAPGPEFADKMSVQISQSGKSMYHLLGQSVITVNGDEAGAETYFIAASITGEDGDTTTNLLGGRFADTLVREDGRWLIKRRVVVRDWCNSLNGLPPWEPSMLLTPGLRSSEDPGLVALGMKHSGKP